MSQKFKSDIELQAGLRDSSGSLGASGQILSSTSGNVSWVTPTVNTVARDVQNEVKAGVAINKGQAVYVTGADGTNIIVGLASNTSEATSSKTLGLLNATVAINGKADVVQIGRLAGLNTLGATAGDPVWLGTGGNLIYGLINKPYAPAHLVFIGVVTRVNASNGEIFINVQNGFELKEIHDVDIITTVPINGDILGYNGTLWVNKTIAGWLGYTPANASGTTNYVSKFTGTTTLGNSLIYDDGSNVGIGTTSPSAKLDVNGTLNVGSLSSGSNAVISLANNASGGTRNIYYKSSDVTINITSTGGNDLMTITNGGNVGIGTTSPSNRLTVSSGAYSSSSTVVSILNTNSAQKAHVLYDTFLIQQDDAPTLRIYETAENASATISLDNGLTSFAVTGEIGLFVNGDPGAQGWTGLNGTQAVRIKTNGNVGIGTSSPSYKTTIASNPRNTDVLCVVSDQINADGAQSYVGISLQDQYANGGGNASAIRSYSNLYSQWGSTLTFSTTGTAGNGVLERMRITNSGNVGIGTTSPFSKMEIAGPATNWSNSPSITLTDNAGTVNSRRWLIGNVATDYGSLNFAVSTTNSTDPTNSKMTITKEGNVGIGTTSPAAKLHINNGADRNLWFRINGNGTGTELLSINDSQGTRQSLAFSASSFYFDIGNVGIGTTSPSAKTQIFTDRYNDSLTFNATAGFIVGGSIRQLSINTDDTSPYNISLQAKTNGNGAANIILNSLGGNVGIGTTDVDSRFKAELINVASLRVAYNGTSVNYYDANENIFRSGSGTERMRITSAGDVAVGTTAALLNTSGRGNITINGSSESILTLATGGTWKSYFFTTGGNTLLGAANEMTFGTNGGTERMRITSGGNVGIGTSSPGANLDVNGTIRTGQKTIYNITTPQPPANFGNGKIYLRLIPTSNTLIATIRVTISGEWNWAPIFGTIVADYSFYNVANTLNSPSRTVLTANGLAASNLRLGNLEYENGYLSIPIYCANSNGVSVTIESFVNSINIASVSFSSWISETLPDQNSVYIPTSLGIGTTSPLQKLDVDGLSYFRNDIYMQTNKGIFFSGNGGYGAGVYGQNSGNDLLINAGGNEKMRINSGGNVGIGTSSPGAKLDVAGALGGTIGVGGSTIRLVNTDTGNAGSITAGITGVTNEGMQFSTDGTVRMVINSGNVGIGTTSPSSKLHVSGGYITVSGTDTNQIFLEGIRTGTSTTLRIYDNASTVYYDSYATMAFRANQNGGSGGNIVFTGGNVGIGTSSPSSKLHLSGQTTNITITDTTYNRTSNIGYIDNANLYFANDGASNTYIGRYNNVFLAYGGGNVGIGTTNPLSKLNSTNSYYSGTPTKGNSAAFFDNQGVGIYIGGNEYSYGYIQAEQSDNTTIKNLALQPNGGNVGIGTTSPSYKLDVNGTGKFVDQLKVFNSAYPATYATSLRTDSGAVGVLQLGNNNDNYILAGNTGANGYLIFRVNCSSESITSGIEAMRITSSGNVGIGTTTPQGKLNAIGDIIAGSFTYTTGVNIQNRTAKSVLYISTDGVNNAVGSTITYAWADGGQGPLKFNNASGEVMRLNDLGKLGVGTTNPTSKLHSEASISGPVSFDFRCAVFGYNTSTDTVYNNPIGIAGKVLTSGGIAVYGNATTGSGWGGYFDGKGYFSGNVGIGTTSPSYPLYVSAQVSNVSIYADYDIVAFSDQSVKENIRPIDNVIERVIESRGVLYDRIDSGEKDNIGFIAQELEVAFPELVVTNQDGTKAVKYQNAVAVLFEAVKEQQKQIDEIKRILNGITN